MADLELHIYDFDGTLFRSPQSPEVWSGQDWWSDISSLSEPCVPENPSEDWWITSTISMAKKSISNPNVFSIMMTGRKDKSGFRYRIPELLSQQGLSFDMVKLSNSESTSQEKINTIKEILAKSPDIKKIKIWDDKNSDLEKFKIACIEMGIDKESIEINHVNELSKIPECKFEPTQYKIDKEKFKKPNYIGIFLDSASKSEIIKAFDAKHEKIENDHVTLSLKPFIGMEDLIGKIVKMKIVGYSEDDLGQAVAIEIPEELRMENKIYHITISHSDKTNAKYSNELLGKGFKKINGPEVTGVIDVYPRSLTIQKLSSIKTSTIKKGILEKLTSLADVLDSSGFSKEADAVDELLLKVAYDNQALDRWFKEKWVDISRKVKGKHPPCGRPDADTGKYPKCRPAKRVSKKTPKTTKELSSSEKKKAITEKRRTEKKPSESAGGKARKPKIAPALKRRK